MTNPYLERLQGRAQEKQHSSQPSKPSKPDFESFEGDRGCHFSADERSGFPKNTIPAYPQNHQNLGSLSVPAAPLVEPSLAYRATSAEPDGTACRVEIVELPVAVRYRKVFAFLQLKPPARIPEDRWRLAVEDGSRFLAKWGEQAEALGWDSRDLFGLHAPPDKPHSSYNRLSRYDCTGLCWLLQGKEVIALTEATATIQNHDTGAITTYRRFNKPGLGPLGDSLDDLNPGWRQ
jgi:hypothetical protein